MLPKHVSSSSLGRSPRMRGKLRALLAAEKDRRSIPAYAGETSAALDHAGLFAVDPRVCGGNGAGAMVPSGP